MNTNIEVRLFPIAGLLLTVGLVAACSASPSPSAAASADDEALTSVPQHPTRQVCPDPIGTTGARCLATIRTDVPEGFTPDFADAADAGAPDAGSTGISYGPADIASAYSLPAGGGAGTTVAIIDYTDDPSAESDLAFYRASYGLPPCTTANGCFTKVNGAGQASPLPAPNFNTAVEITLDLDAVSAACPACKILLVEPDPATSSLDVSVDTAAMMGATFISLSWGYPEVSPNAFFGVTKAAGLAAEPHYVHPGVAIFASTGDKGFATSPDNQFDGEGPLYPSDIPEVFAVGGTTLVRSKGNARGWSEKVWGPEDALGGATNSGCSSIFPKPSYQTSLTACTGREVADLSAVADPNTGLNIYITYTSTDTASSDYFPRGWNVVGGTSLASPLTAAMFAATGLLGKGPSFAYANAADFHDVTTGNDGTCKEPSLCNAREGYDAPSGNGTFDGARLAGK